MAEEIYTMSAKELERIHLIEQVLAKRLKQREAAQRLQIGTRQIKRLTKAYREEGAKALCSKRRGQPSNRQYSKRFKRDLLDVVGTHYRDFTPTLAREKLLEREGLTIGRETLRQWMIEAGYCKGRPHRASKVHQSRARRPCLGELIQIDGSYHDWFEGRADPCCLLVFIDDATSRLMHLEFVAHETTWAYLNAVRTSTDKHGRPAAYYSDKHSIFRINQPEAKTGTGETQFARAMRELGIELICAHSPQAKGRVERANSTLQDRLVKELRLQGIDEASSANAYLPTFIEAHNARFAVAAQCISDAHRPVTDSNETLARIFCLKERRRLTKNLECSYKNTLYQIQVRGQGYRLRHAYITMCETEEGEVSILRKGQPLSYQCMDKQKREARVVSGKELNGAVDDVLKADQRADGHTPAKSHPWGYAKQHKRTIREGAAA